MGVGADANRVPRRGASGAPLRVLLVATDLGRGGAERVLETIALGLDRRAFAVEVAGMKGPGPTGDALAAKGFAVHDLGARRARDGPRAVARLVGLLRRGAFDVVHASLFHAGLAARLAAAAIDAFAGRRPAVICAIHTVERRAIFRLLADAATARLADRFVAVSEAVRRFAAGPGRLPARRLVVIRNGVDLPTAPRAAPPASTADGPWLCVARLHRDKDIATLLDAWALIRASLGDRAPPLLIAGDGAERAALEARAAALGLCAAPGASAAPGSPLVRFLGERSDVPALLAGAAALVLSSRVEGLGLAALEAQAAGLPVVATRAGGLVEAVVEGATGLLVPPGRPRALAAAVLALVRDPAHARRLGEAGPSRIIRDGLTSEAMVARYAAIYEEVAAARA